MHSNFLSSSPAATQQKERERERKEMDLTSADHHAAAASTCPGCLSSTWLQDSTSPLLWCLALVLDRQSCMASCLVDSQRFQTQWVPGWSLLFMSFLIALIGIPMCSAPRHKPGRARLCWNSLELCSQSTSALNVALKPLVWERTESEGRNSKLLESSVNVAAVGMACRKPVDIMKMCTHAPPKQLWCTISTVCSLGFNGSVSQSFQTHNVQWFSIWTGELHPGFYWSLQLCHFAECIVGAPSAASERC